MKRRIFHIISWGVLAVFCYVTVIFNLLMSAELAFIRSGAEKQGGELYYILTGDPVWAAADEIEIDGQMYDVKFRYKSGSRQMMACIADTHETGWKLRKKNNDRSVNLVLNTLKKFVNHVAGMPARITAPVMRNMLYGAPPVSRPHGGFTRIFSPPPCC